MRKQQFRHRCIETNEMIPPCRKSPVNGSHDPADEPTRFTSFALDASGYTSMFQKPAARGIEQLMQPPAIAIKARRQCHKHILRRQRDGGPERRE